ncbi:AcrR family transcriptional regulator [Mycolicibacterium iranicum]|uniref:AcrR family transcriptional regulator n=1 Tax=Mycolicibacterium iranicum TaxID=912594 RepID=A0A839Q9K5_MYCIR|nr:TetR/AcrR family transcriptional regulator [Mycolicibacterium iranicum]MBB2992670.1 AcrR family transcriptional regulator [Mycolicibacterium iranicum]
MTDRGRSADPRAERVRAQLRGAAFNLAHEAPLDRISVGDLVERAEVSRQVFYRHFRDRDDAVAAAFSEVFADVVREAPSGDSDSPVTDTNGARSRILQLFAFAEDHPTLYRNVVPSTVHQHVLGAYRAALLPPCRQIAAQGMAVLDTVSPIPADAVTRFLVGGFMEVLRSWMEDPADTDLHSRVRAALDTVDALLGLTSAQKGPDHG